MIGIIDYGAGNLANVKNACEKLGHETLISSVATELENCSGLILPGVGAFEKGMEALEKRGLVSFIKEWAKKEKPLLGICLGMQLLFDSSTEDGLHDGLGLIPGEVVSIPKNVKVPHMGYNELILAKPLDPIVSGVKNGDYVYFVHSYYAKTPREYIVATCDYSVAITAIVRRGSLVATQFHPEKSSVTGVNILKNYLESIK